MNFIRWNYQNNTLRKAPNVYAVREEERDGLRPQINIECGDEYASHQHRERRQASDKQGCLSPSVIVSLGTSRRERTTLRLPRARANSGLHRRYSRTCRRAKPRTLQHWYMHAADCAIPDLARRKNTTTRRPQRDRRVHLVQHAVPAAVPGRFIFYEREA